MKDEHDKQTRDLLSGDQIRKTAAERQARLLKRRAAEGWYRKTVWIHEPSRLAGVAAAERGDPCDPSGMDEEYRVSWVLGWDAASNK
jgi:hypothetical protein